MSLYLAGIVLVLCGCHAVDVEHGSAGSAGARVTEDLLDNGVPLLAERPQLADGRHRINGSAVGHWRDDRGPTGELLSLSFPGSTPSVSLCCVQKL